MPESELYMFETPPGAADKYPAPAREGRLEMMREVTIKQTAAGWINCQTGRTHKSAALALKAVKRADMRGARLGDGLTLGIATRITWELRNGARRDLGQAIQ